MTSLPFVPSFLFLLLAAVAVAQESEAKKESGQGLELAPGNVAFVRIVNAIGLKTPTKVSFRTAAEPKWAELAPGEASGMRALRLGNYRLKVANEGCERPEVEDTIALSTGGIYAVIVLYTEPVMKDGKVVHRLQYSKLNRTTQPDHPRLSIVSLIDVDALPIELGDRTISLPRRRAQHFDLKLNQSITVRHHGAEVMEPFELAEAIPYLVFLFPNEATGRIEGSLVREISVVLELPRSMKEKQPP
jgi:hypothetical protein